MVLHGPVELAPTNQDLHQLCHRSVNSHGYAKDWIPVYNRCSRTAEHSQWWTASRFLEPDFLGAGCPST